MNVANQGLDQKCVNTIRFLAADGIQKANSGHPGICLGAAPMAYLLWKKFLKHNPENPAWPDRDRFVLSAGHGSMLLYALLHLFGYDLPLEELMNFRQWGSKTPGHPESHLTPGVEATTGPLGQGISSAVGMALAEAHLAARYNRPGFDIVDHFTYTITGDGDLMEGVASEACSLAGHLGLGKLIALYDDNRISLAGTTSLSFTEDVGKRFEAYGWQVLTVEDGNDLAAIEEALREARGEERRPSLITVRTVIGYGAPHKQNTFGAHGSPLGEEELKAAKENLGWPPDKDFFIPGEVLEDLRRAVEKGTEAEARWRKTMESYTAENPEAAAEFIRIFSKELPADWDEGLPDFSGEEALPTRKASGEVLQVLGKNVPELMGGSADLNPSTLTALKGYGDFQRGDKPPEGIQGAVGGGWGYEGRNIHFGVREHAMGSISLGMALHGGLIPFTATFLVFADYMRPPIRLSALSEKRVIFVFTHDSILLGEDGPTHQPVEQLMNLRSVPNLTVIRPADAGETAEAWRAALLNKTGPTVLVFTRQKVPVLDRARLAPAAGLRRGGYILWQSSEEEPELILIATGSEVAPALVSAEKLAAEKIKVRVVSLPSWEIFDRQPADYRESVLPSAVTARLSVEAGIALGWEHYVGLSGEIIGMESYGASAPAEILREEFGFTPENIFRRARRLLERSREN